MAEGQEPWVPTSKEDWAEVFSMGLKKHREETFNEAAAFEEMKEKSGNGNGGQSGDTTPPKRRTLGDLLLGIPAESSANSGGTSSS